MDRQEFLDKFNDFTLVCKSADASCEIEIYAKDDKLVVVSRVSNERIFHECQILSAMKDILE